MILFLLLGNEIFIPNIIFITHIKKIKTIIGITQDVINNIAIASIKLLNAFSPFFTSSDNFLNEVKKTDLAIGNAIGVSDYCSHLFRFPNGFMSPSNKSKKKEAVKLLQDIEYNYIDWNCLNNDSIKKYSSSQLLNNLIKSSKNKDILVILMHDTKDVSNSSLVLKDSIKYLKGKGYVFKNFYDIMPNILIMK